MITDIGYLIILGISTFVSTNIDDIFLLIVFFSNVLRYPPYQVVIGQYIGIGLLVAISIIFSLVSLVIPSFLIGLLGFVPIIIGSVISVIGFSSLLMYHSTEFEIIINLSIIAGGLSLSEVGGFNITLVSVSPKVSGISMGITVLLFLIGMSIGPAISGIYLETFQSPIMLNKISYSFPSAFSYDMIFLTSALLSFVFLILAIVTAKKIKSTKVISKYAKYDFKQR